MVEILLQCLREVSRTLEKIGQWSIGRHHVALSGAKAFIAFPIRWYTHITFKIAAKQDFQLHLLTCWTTTTSYVVIMSYR